MKLLCLNIWGARLFNPLINFIKERNGEIDIFCFQEVFKSEKNIFHNEIKTNAYSDFQEILTGYKAYFAPMFEGHDTKQNVDFELYFGQAIFIKKNIKVVKEGNIFIYAKYGHEKVAPTLNIPGFEDFLDYPRSMQYLVVDNNRQETLICNLHGYWQPTSKGDTPERLQQSNKIINFLKKYDYPKILCGDFNLNPNTQSIKKIEKNLRNLITEYDVKKTRSKFYTRDERFADYIFVSPDVRVNEFRVMDAHVSDHLPLYLKFE